MTGAPQELATTGSAGRGGSRARRAVKRALDVLGSLAALVVLSPILAGAAVAVKISMGSPILFRQPRPGRDGELFTILKFRTMREARPDETWFDSDADRVTRVGRFLRRTSIDELPELWNVLRGQMSLVGPRPLLPEYLPHYTDRQRLRHCVRPGLTGWAATSGRHTLRFEDRLELDVWYVENWSLSLDLRILFKTVLQVLGRESVTETQDLGEIDFPAHFAEGLTSGPAGGEPAAPLRPDAPAGPRSASSDAPGAR